MAREYIVAMVDQTIAGASTMVFINPGVTAGVEVLRAWASQAANATSAQQRIQLSSQVTAFPTLTSTAPQTLKILDPAAKIIGGTAGAAGTSGTDATAEGGGAKTVIIPDAFNVLNGFLWVPTPPETVVINASAASGIGLVFPAAPTNLDNWTAAIIYRELG